MRDYGKVHTTFWSSDTVRSMSEDARTLAMYLLTSPHGTIAGVFRLPDGYACEDLQWTSQRLSKGFAELLAKGFANRCETTKWAWIRKHLDWNPPENPNQRKSAAKVVVSIPDECDWKLDFMRVCGPSLGFDAPPEPNPSQTVSEPLPNQYQEQEQEKRKTRKRAPAAQVVSVETMVSEGVDPQNAADWLTARKVKRLPLTPTAWAETKAEAAKAGLGVPEAIKTAAAHGWGGFRASWLTPEVRRNGDGRGGGELAEIFRRGAA